MIFQRYKFVLGGLLVLAAVIFLIFTSTNMNAEYFMTVEELLAQPGDPAGRNLRISGAVIGDSIAYDPETLELSFDVAHVPADNDEIEALGGLANVLHAAVSNPQSPRLHVLYTGPKPDLLRDEAQAILTGHLGDDGNFHADELLLKCPTKYEEALPEQAGDS